MSYLKYAKEILNIEKAGISSISDQLNESFDNAINAINESLCKKGKVVVVGIGKNWHIGNKIAATFNSTGTLSAVMHPIEAMHGDFGMLADNDIVIAISYSGESEEMIALLTPVKRRNIPIIALTSNHNSSLGKNSNIIINTSIPKEACPFNLAPTTSTTATLALGDALAMVILKEKGFKLEDYARRHPGGAIGRTLILRVEDIMRTDDRFACIEGHKSIREAIIEMTNKKSGSVAVLNEDKKLIGILTDGDLRRHLIEKPNLIELSVDQIMTKNPITLKTDMLAADVIRLYENHDVDDLIVVDDIGIAIGSVDIQDMPKLKII